MAAIIIDGKATAEKIKEKIKARTAALKEKGVIPCLAVILVGEDPASLSYVTGKKKALAETGMGDRELRLPADTTEEVLLEKIAFFNADPKVHGILVQLPLPSHIDEDKVICAIAPEKDVDGFHPVSAGNLVLGKKGFVPGTPLGIIHLINE